MSREMKLQAGLSAEIGPAELLIDALEVVSALGHGGDITDGVVILEHCSLLAQLQESSKDLRRDLDALLQTRLDVEGISKLLGRGNDLEGEEAGSRSGT